jgi:hypothetical protein
MREKVEHRIGVRAPAEAIWSLVAEIDAWPAWNPLYPRAQGRLRIGERLDLDVALPGRPLQTIRPVIVDWVPNEQVIWRLSMLGGLAKSIRYIEIDQLTETGAILSNGEIFDGLLGPWLARRMRGPLKAGFAAMGEAIKARAEAALRQGAGEPS